MHPVVKISLLAIVIAIWQSKYSSSQDVRTAPAGAVPSKGPIPPGPPMPGQPMPPMPGQPVPGQPAPGQPMPGGKAEEKAKTTSRPMKPATPPNKDELKVRPDANGMLRFNFRGQPWLEVLDWLAQVSGMSLDWQEMPSDFLNLTTQREYTVTEARDLVNRHLLARGFTLLQNGEILTVQNISKLDPGLVPRVEPADLSGRQQHEFVKVSFKLKWLLAETAVEELKPMLSPNGKLTALKSTNRVEAIDAVNNLQQIWSVLSVEQSKDGQDRLVREFELKYARAAEVQQQLSQLLGLDAKKSPAGPMTPEQQQQMQQQAMMMAQQQQQRGGQPAPQAKKPDEIHLIVNIRRNSVLANAPSDRMAVIEQAIEKLDVAGASENSLFANIGRIQVYRLASLDPEPLVKTLEDSGSLDPTTKLDIDRKNRAIIANASMADHLTIRRLIEKLDASGRRFEVIQLRRLESDYVAGTIEMMMGGDNKDNKQNNRNYDYFFGYYGSSRSRESETPQDKFRVDADVEFNRLLLWTNDIELVEVENLLVKLGEIPPKGGRVERTRVLDAISPEDAAELIERLRRAWPNVAPNELQLPTLPESSTSKEKSRPEKSPTDESGQTPAEAATEQLKKSDSINEGTKDNGTKDEGKKAEPKKAKPTAVTRLYSPGLDDNLLALADEGAPKANQEAEIENDPIRKRIEAGLAEEVQRRRAAAVNRGAPVRVAIGPDGRVVITSDDTQALDVLEEMIGQLAPPKRDFQVFTLKYAPAYWVKLNLEEFFEEKDDKKDTGRSRFFYYYDYGMPNQQNSKDRNKLSRRKPVKFISDYDTNTILVQGADAGQLRTIQDLIDLYDIPEPADSQSARVSGVFTIKYSKAKVVADTIKDVYRDLLSSNDRALNNNPENQSKQSSQNTYITNYGGEDEKKKEKTQVAFKGKLSIGVDEHSNTLLVSTEGENLYRNVSNMIQELDKAAITASNIQVRKLDGTVNAEKVGKALQQMFKKPPTQPQQGQNGQQPNEGGQPNQEGQFIQSGKR